MSGREPPLPGDHPDIPLKCSTHVSALQPAWSGKTSVVKKYIYFFFFLWVCRHFWFHMIWHTWHEAAWMYIHVQHEFVQKRFRDTAGQSSWLSAGIFSARGLPTCSGALHPPHWWGCERLGPRCDIRIPLSDPLDPSHYLFPSRPLLRGPVHIREAQSSTEPSSTST